MPDKRKNNGKYNRKRKRGQRKRTNINLNGWCRRRTRDGISSPGTTAKQPRQDARVIIDSDGDQSDYKVRPSNTRALILSAGTTHDINDVDKDDKSINIPTALFFKRVKVVEQYRG